MSGFIEWLESLSAKDTKVKAILRRSLSFDPGEFPASFPYVEPFLTDESGNSTRKAYYLAAGLWALHWREGRGKGISLGQASALYQANSKSTSMERRFINVLDSEPDQLPHRLRQMVALLKDYDLEFEGLLKALLHWTSEGRWVQIQWAKDFYRNLETITSSLKPKEQEKPE